MLKVLRCSSNEEKMTSIGIQKQNRVHNWAVSFWSRKGILPRM